MKLGGRRNIPKMKSCCVGNAGDDVALLELRPPREKIEESMLVPFGGTISVDVGGSLRRYCLNIRVLGTGDVDLQG